MQRFAAKTLPDCSKEEEIVKAAVCYEAGKPLVVEDIDIDTPKKGEVKVRMVATAVCHSDIHVVKGDIPEDMPCVAGHESAGYIEEVGEGVTSVKPGDPVVASLLVSCGKCYYCTTGRPHMCEAEWYRDKEYPYQNKKGQRLKPLVRIGSFAEYIILDESQVVKVPEDIALDRAALLACGVITGFGGVVNRAGVKPFQSVVVMGTGGVGINAIQGAAYSGAYPIIAMDILDTKMEMAMEFGATHMVNANREDAAETIRELTRGRGAEFVFVPGI